MAEPAASLDTNWILEDDVSSLIRHWAGRLSRSRGFSRSDQPDIEQDLRTHLLSTAIKFDSNRGKPSAFAAPIIKNKAKSMIRATRRQRRDSQRCISIDSDLQCGDGAPMLSSQSIEESEGRRHTGQRRRLETELTQLKLDVADANETLPQSLRDMAALLSHVRLFAAAQVLRISRRQATLHVATLRECYEARGLTP